MRYRNAHNLGTGPGIGKSLNGSLVDEVGNENDVRFGYRVNVEDADPPYLNFSTQLGRGARTETRSLASQENLIVGHQHNPVRDNGGEAEAQAPEGEIGFT